jgi:hypothetical protein
VRSLTGAVVTRRQDEPTHRLHSEQRTRVCDEDVARHQELKAGRRSKLRTGDGNVVCSGLAKVSMSTRTADHELSHQNGPRGGGRRGSGPRSRIGPPQSGQTSRL